MTFLGVIPIPNLDVHVADWQTPGLMTRDYAGRFVVLHPRDYLNLRVELSLYKYAKKQAMRELIGRTWRLGKKLPTWGELESWAGRLA